jgi:riboflavin kinase
MILTIKGKVFTGVSEGKRFTELPWVKKQIMRQLGFEPYPGTLDLLVSSDFQIGIMLSRFRGRDILPEEGYFSGRLYKALIMERVLGALVRPEIPGYPEDTVEILAPICLREELDLRDGDEVEVKIWLE